LRLSFSAPVNGTRMTIAALPLLVQ
jgi:hypothetical protein